MKQQTLNITKELPPFNDREQQHLIKEGIIDYFEQNEYVDLTSVNP
tara:strand:+ start:15106 stop:15243 length:138 start_codon:yes stop_codon:yes gene_type:complete